MRILALTFGQLLYSLRSVHMNNKTDIDTLHDLWLLGAPTPDSRLLDMKAYDPRLYQPANVEKRIIIPEKLATWIEETAKSNGLEYRAGDGLRAVNILTKHSN